MELGRSRIMKFNYRKKKKKSPKDTHAHALHLYKAHPSLVSWQEIKMSNICRGENLMGRILTRGPSLVATSPFFHHPLKIDGMSPSMAIVIGIAIAIRLAIAIAISIAIGIVIAMPIEY
jgi:hypothetical protein